MTMTMRIETVTAAPVLRVIEGGAARSTSWWEKRALTREIVGGCPDHWWKPTAPRTAACTCDRF
jgi:hypothetical protein